MAMRFLRLWVSELIRSEKSVTGVVGFVHVFGHAGLVLTRLSGTSEPIVQLMKEGGFVHARIRSERFSNLDEDFVVTCPERFDRLLDKKLERHRARLFAAVQQIRLNPGRGDLLNLN